MARNQDYEDTLLREIAKFKHDPLGFVYFAFPWGEPGSLEKFDGPQPWQRDVLIDIGKIVSGGGGVDDVARELAALLGEPAPIDGGSKGRVAVASGKGVGKAQAKSLTVLTPTGFRRWGDLQPGDLIFAENGMPTRILQVHDQGIRPMARVTFEDGASTLVDYDHFWKVMGNKQRRTKHGMPTLTDNWVVRSTQELLDEGLRFGGKLNGRNFDIPLQGAVAFPPRRLPLDPYLLGVWLGDGARGSPLYTKPYPEVTAEVTRRGYEVRTRSCGQARYVLGIKHIADTIPVMQLNSYDRYVPEEYKLGSIDQRRDILCGLLDTDGECNSVGSIIFSSSSRELVEDVMWLARSLGGKAQMQQTTKFGAYRDKDGNKVECRDCHRATLALPFNPFRIAHKASRWHMPERRYFKRWIDKIEPAGEEEAMCISIEHPSHCYLANDFIVTHNSSLVSWIVMWAMSTFPDTKGVITAGTEPQLRTKTWPEVMKWFQLLICKHWFVVTATSMYSCDPEHAQTWRFDAIPWNAARPEAFAGLHNIGKRIVLIMDEASSIEDTIFDTSDGIFTDADTEVLHLAFGNPTRGVGRFFELFHRLRHRWHCTQLDSRTVPISDKAQIQAWLEDFGENSDYFRVNVRGQFPRVSSMQFIGSDLVAEARGREAHSNLHDALVMGVDVARFGDDTSVISFRKGRDARTIPWIKLRNVDTQALAMRIVEAKDRYKVDQIFIDGGGVGAGVIDRLRALGHSVIEIQFGASADRVSLDLDAARYANKRAEMWGYMKESLKTLAIPDDPDLTADLTGLMYSYRDGKKGAEIILEKKEHMKARGLASPDNADSLCLCFAYPVLPKNHAGGPHMEYAKSKQGQATTEYDPIA